MRKLLLTGITLLIAGVLHAADVNRVTISSNVVVSTTSWTVVPAAVNGNQRFRSGIIIDNYGTNTGDMLMIFTNSASTPTAPTSNGMTVTPEDRARRWNVGDKVYLWMISLHTAAENVFYQELK